MTRNDMKQLAASFIQQAQMLKTLGRKDLAAPLKRRGQAMMELAQLDVTQPALVPVRAKCR